MLRKIWSTIRSTKIKRKHSIVSNYWKPVVENYYQNQLEIPVVKRVKELSSDQIIWQYWGQGIENDTLPEVVNLCFKSVDKYCADFSVIRLNDENIADYLEFPSYLIDKLHNGSLSRTFFSDILRLALLYHYGGVWLDATILLTDSLPKKMMDLPYFMFQRDPNEEHKTFWEQSYAYYWGWDKNFRVKVLNSIIFAKKGNKVIRDSLNLLLYYWQKESNPIDYFFYQILYQHLIENQLKDQKCMLLSDVFPHILQTKFNGSAEFYQVETVLAKCSLHKMSYFDENGKEQLKKFIQKFNVL